MSQPAPAAGVALPEPVATDVAAKHPWHRWFARVWLDYVFASVGLGFAVAIVSPGSSLLSSGYGLTWIAAVLWIPIEALLLSTIGTTPGKYLVGISIERADGSLLSFGEALNRAASAWAVGCALLIPIASLFTFNSQYNRLRKGRDSTWDEKGGIIVKHITLSLPRILLLLLATATVLGLMVLGSMTK